MATDMSKLQGEIEENPVAPALHESEGTAVEKLMMGFLRSLLDEQKPSPTPIPIPTNSEEIPSFLVRRESV